MSLYKKSDVKNHLSTRGGSNLLPFRPMSQPDATGYSENEHRDATVSPLDILTGADSPSDKSTVKKPQA